MDEKKSRLKRRYTKYSLEDTQRAIQHQQTQAGVRILSGSASPSGRRVRIYSEKHHCELWTLIAAKSSDWYKYNLNTYKSGIEAIIAGTHDSCVSVPVLAMDTLEWTAPYKTRFEDSLPPPQQTGREDTFARFRKSSYGHRVLVGALIVGRKEAIDRLMTLKPRTRFRIEAEVKRLRHRRAGRPLKLW
jgi:hypothetical protein